MRKPTKGKRSKAARRKRRVIIFLIEIIVLLMLLGGLYVAHKFGKLQTVKFDKGSLVRNDVDTEATEGYTTIALFGLDSRDVESLGKGNQSDTIMIASINNKTKEVKLASVYRDTYLNMTDDTYNKANAAYSVGGPEKAISMLNMNLDLVIEDYVTINFMALIEVIDALGGVEIDVTEGEVVHVNNYMVETRTITGKDSPNLTSSGLQKLTGLQATAYCRIRQIGNDYQRTERQRLVLSEISKEIKKTDIVTINSIADSVLGQVNTSLKTTEILELVAGALSYELGENTGFPFTKIAPIEKINGMDVVIACGLAYNVTKLHEFLYEAEDYQVSSKVQSISDYIVNFTGIETQEIVEDTTTEALTDTTTE